jgi:hypothetical protein
VLPLPKVLAGPIVRRVEPRSCSFWVALSQEATVRASIWKGERNAPVSSADTPAGTGELKTRRIAAKLHVAVVTVDLTGSQPLESGALYAYDMVFAFTGGPTSDLQGESLLEDELAGARLAGVDAAAPLQKALGFVEDRLPTFLAPPAKFVGTPPAEGLRIAHCSCRRPAAGSFDALAAVAPLVGDADQRPHQLYLTGDQVYADDISTTHLPLLISLAADVMGGSQPLPGFPPDPRTGGSGSTPVTGAGLPGDLANLPPLRRKWLLWQLAGFTGSDTGNHAITFGEFVALHLLAWSPRVWRQIPAFADVFKAPGIAGGASTPAPAIAPWLNRPWFCSAADPTQAEPTLKRDWSDPAVNTGAFEGYNRAAHHLARYAAASPAVAQVLANTPTYMIFDDHEVADDWNINGRWVSKVYPRQWGRFVVRNGLLAYTLMQAWGNDPAHFSGDKAGKKVLDAMPAAVSSGAATPNLDILLGFDKPTPAQPKRIAFNYSFENADYKVAVLDTRTHRAINNTTLEPPNLIDNLDEQLPDRPATATQKLLLVVSPVPVFSPVVIEQMGQPLAQLAIDNVHAKTIGEVPGFAEGDVDDPRASAGCGTRGERGGEKYDREGWSAHEPGFEALVARLASYGTVVILSGDVHYASTTVLDYWKKPPTEPARLVQCISSPSKNVFKDVVDQIIRKVGNLQQAAEVPMERLAWTNGIEASALIPAGARISLARRSRLRKKPALVPTSPWPPGSKLPDAAAKKPDWRWRIQSVTDLVTKLTDLPAGIDGLQPTPIDEAALTDPLDEQLVAIAEAHQTRLLENRPLLRRLVFAPNFGTVQFEQKPGGPEVVHRLHTPATAKPFAPSEKQPLPAGPPSAPNVAFGPHTVHRAPLKAPATETPPEIRAQPGG